MKKVLTLSLAATLASTSVAFAHGGGAKFFERLDGNGDGQVTQQEMLSTDLERFDNEDANKDGKVTPEERKAAHEAFIAEHPEIAEKMQKRAERHGKRGGERAEGRAKKMAERMNETITRSDVETRAKERFTKMDANADGVLTEDELKRGHGCKHGRGHGEGEGEGGERSRGKGRSMGDAGA